MHDPFRKVLFMQKLTGVSPCLREASDSILVQQVLGGNHDAFAILMDRYHSLLYRFVYHYLGEYDQACDVVQHVFLQLYISLPKLLTGDRMIYHPWQPCPICILCPMRWQSSMSCNVGSCVPYSPYLRNSARWYFCAISTSIAFQKLVRC